MSKRQRLLWPINAMVLSLIIICVISMGRYIHDYYHATAEAQAVLEQSEVTVEQINSRTIAFVPEQPKAALVFYPGGKVEYTAYAPLMQELSKQGFLCLLEKMPLNLAVLDITAADGLREKFPEIEKWYIGGHSLGGAMAAIYASRHADELDGLVLLGGYSTTDLRRTKLKALCIYGSNDRVMNREKYQNYKSNLPTQYVETVISGGNHAYFGSYGEQKGDGTASITNDEQMAVTASICRSIFLEGDD
ncbi:alpha/beta fold hydrolase [Butyricicoccus sp.]|uniref:alpha/beta fold hydrolase n=1 Tax=Butyricicoccus sp. TaxID=2049021 RepID=UPI003D7CB289